MLNPIGGYFELELRNGSEYHNDAIRLNTGRNALEYILRANKYSKVLIPYFTCDTIIEPFEKLGISYEFYSINSRFEPDIDYNNLNNNTGFLYTNYFGIKNSYVKILSNLIDNLIIDNAQSFFSTPIPGIDTFYSARKFFGIPDGAYLYSNTTISIELAQDQSNDRISHLIKRLENGPETGFSDFKANDASLSGQSIKIMSKLTKRLLSNIDYKNVANRRIENFRFLFKKLSKINEIDIEIEENSVPMLYPLLLKNNNLKQVFIENRIFIPTYWPNVFEWSKENTMDYFLSKNLLPIPIDQRYTISDMKRIVDLIMTAGY